ncbi:MAG: hypothetical protein H8D34_32905, partial [Chloroflexi bacterium]|nr:hypothetical protein [Chloroflexota bacterium]
MQVSFAQVDTNEPGVETSEPSTQTTHEGHNSENVESPVSFSSEEEVANQDNQSSVSEQGGGDSEGSEIPANTDQPTESDSNLDDPDPSIIIDNTSGLEDPAPLSQENETEGADADVAVEAETSVEAVVDNEEISVPEIENPSAELCEQSGLSEDDTHTNVAASECAIIEEAEALEMAANPGDDTEVEDLEPTQTTSVEDESNEPGQIIDPVLPDPYFYVTGVKHSYLPIGGDCSGKTNCNVSATPIQDALNFAKGKSLDDNSIYFESGTYSENFIIDGFSNELILRPEDSATASFTNSISILNNSVPITIRDFTFNNGSTVTVNNSSNVTLVGTDNADYFDIYLTGSAEINLEVGGSDGNDELIVNGTSGTDTIKFQSKFTRNGNQTVEYEAVEGLGGDGGGGGGTLGGPGGENSFDISGGHSG